MAEATHDLFGSTSMQGCIPSARALGPVFHEDGRLLLNESFTALETRDEAKNTLERFRSGWLVEAWRIWDCYEQDWAACNIVLYRFEEVDVVVRDAGNAGVCVWTGAVDVRSRVRASRDDTACEECCWQWLRDPDIADLPTL